MCKAEENVCVGTCKETELSTIKQQTLEEGYENMDLDKLKEEVKKLRMMAVKAASELHDLAEEGLPNRWKDIPSVSQKVYEIHKTYYKAKSILEERLKS